MKRRGTRKARYNPEDDLGEVRPLSDDEFKELMSGSAPTGGEQQDTPQNLYSIIKETARHLDSVDPETTINEAGVILSESIDALQRAFYIIMIAVGLNSGRTKKDFLNFMREKYPDIESQIVLLSRLWDEQERNFTGAGD